MEDEDDKDATEELLEALGPFYRASFKDRPPVGEGLSYADWARLRRTLCDLKIQKGEEL